MIRLSEEQEAEIRQLILDGLPMKKVSERTGIGLAALYKRKSGLIAEMRESGLYAFDHDKGANYCYDEARDCVNYFNHNCRALRDTRFSDNFGRRKVCPFYKHNDRRNTP